MMIRRGASAVSVEDIMFIISEPSEASFTVSKRDLLLRELLLVRSPSIPLSCTSLRTMSALRVLYDGVVFLWGACSGIYRAGSPAYFVMSWVMDFCIYLNDGSLNVRVGPWLYA